MTRMKMQMQMMMSKLKDTVMKYLSELDDSALEPSKSGCLTRG